MWPYKKKTILCDGCHKKLRNKKNYLFYSEYSPLPDIMSDIGLLMLCKSCANLIINAWTLGETNNLPPFDGDVDSASEFNMNTSNGIIKRCMSLGLSPQKAQKKAHELALKLWRNRSHGEKTALDFWKR